MKNNYNPYTVPENFFDNSAEKAISQYRTRRKAIRRGLAAAALIVILFAIPVFLKQEQVSVQTEDMFTNNLAELYEYDIFLQVNF